MVAQTNFKHIGLLVYGRFPTEKAYGGHVFEIAKSFTELGIKTTVFFSKTNNKKSIYEDPGKYYAIDSKINFVEVNNFDFTRFKIYDLLPSFLRKIFWNIGSVVWSKIHSGQFLECDLLWSTNPNLLTPLRKKNKVLIYEKHGAAKYFQKLSIKILSKDKNCFFVGTSKTSYNELSKLRSENTIYLPNGVDLDRYLPNSKTFSSTINIGYIGMLETYQTDKGVADSFKVLKKLAHNYDISVTLIGDPESYRQTIDEEFVDSGVKYLSKKRVPLGEVAKEISKLDIGIVPYPSDYHMETYASPMKIFEYAAAGVVIVASDIKSHKDLSELNLGIKYFEKDNFGDFESKVKELLENKNLIEKLHKLSINNISKFTWNNRSKKLINFASVAQLDRAPDFGSGG